MSQASANLLGGESIEAYSAENNPSVVVSENAILPMNEICYDLSSHDSKLLEKEKPTPH